MVIKREGLPFALINRWVCRPEFQSCFTLVGLLRVSKATWHAKPYIISYNCTLIEQSGSDIATA